MGIFLRYITKNMLEKKGRFVLLILSIMISTALLIVSLGLVDAVIDSFVDPVRNQAEGKDVTIVSDTDEVFFSMDDFNAEGLKDLEGSIATIGVVNEDDEIGYVSVKGREKFDANIMSGSFTDENRAACVISKRIADERGISVGDSITIAINGVPTDFEVMAVSAASGAFYNDKPKDSTVIVPYSYLNDLFGAEGKYNLVRASVVSGEVSKTVESFNDTNDAVICAPLIPDDLTEGTESIVAGMYLMLAVVCIICIIIIHGVFKLIIHERMSVIGTFMSQGATKKKIEHIILSEAMLYGVFGAAVGTVVGELILKVVTRQISPLKEYGIYVPYHVNVGHIIIGVVFAVVLSVISAWMPVRSIRKLQVKDVILNRVETQHKKGSVRFIIGCIFLAASVVFALIPTDYTVNGISIIFMLLFIIGLAMMSRKFIKIVSGALAKLFRGNTTSFLALNNISSSKLLRGNITLLTVAVSAVMFIASMGESMTSMIVDAYGEMNMDYQVYNIIGNNAEVTTTDLILDKLDQIDGIDKSTIMPSMYTYGHVEDQPTYIMASDPEMFADFMVYLHLKSDENIKGFEAYRDGGERDVMLSTSVARHTGTKEGETIKFELLGAEEEFRVVGIFDGGALQNGKLILMRYDTAKKIFNIREADDIVFLLEDGADAEKVEEEMKGFLSDLGAVFISKDDMMKENVKNNAMIVNILAVFSYIALVVASIGIFNNINIAFSQRRKDFAVMASVGMNIKKRRRLVLTESMISVIWSVITAIPFTLVLNKLAVKMLDSMDTPLGIDFSWKAAAEYSIVLAAVIFIASLSAMRKSKKLSVVAELKYE